MIIKCAKRKHSSVLCTCPPTFRSLFLQTVVFTFLSVRSSAGKRLAVNEWMWDKNVEPSTCLQVVWANGKRFVFCMSCAKHHRALLRPEINTRFRSRFSQLVFVFVQSRVQVAKMSEMITSRIKSCSSMQRRSHRHFGSCCWCVGRKFRSQST